MSILSLITSSYEKGLFVDTKNAITFGHYECLHSYSSYKNFNLFE